MDTFDPDNYPSQTELDEDEAEREHDAFFKSTDECPYHIQGEDCRFCERDEDD